MLTGSMLACPLATSSLLAAGHGSEELKSVWWRGEKEGILPHDAAHSPSAGLCLAAEGTSSILMVSLLLKWARKAVEISRIFWDSVVRSLCCFWLEGQCLGKVRREDTVASLCHTAFPALLKRDSSPKKKKIQLAFSHRCVVPNLHSCFPYNLQEIKKHHKSSPDITCSVFQIF